MLSVRKILKRRIYVHVLQAPNLPEEAGGSPWPRLQVLNPEWAPQTEPRTTRLFYNLGLEAENVGNVKSFSVHCSSKIVISYMK
jgi:hypothetical protein